MREEIQLRISKTKVLTIAGIFFVAAAVVIAIFAAMPVLRGNENGLRARVNEIEAESREMPQNPEERDALLQEMNEEFLEIAGKSSDPVLKSRAYLNAGTLALDQFKRKVEEYEVSETKFLDKLSPMDLYNAIAYFQEAARICSLEENRNLCLFGEIQQRLDYSKGLFKKHFSGVEPMSGKEEPLEDESGAQTTGKKKGGKAIDSEKIKVASVGGEVFDNTALDEELQPVPMGSIRGGLSKDPSTYGDNDFDPQFMPGSKYTERHNRP